MVLRKKKVVSDLPIKYSAYPKLHLKIQVASRSSSSSSSSSSNQHNSGCSVHLFFRLPKFLLLVGMSSYTNFGLRIPFILQKFCVRLHVQFTVILLDLYILIFLISTFLRFISCN
jgi:hypothetical protein